jgi:bifunctional non-homologous end joining protein LigD
MPTRTKTPKSTGRRKRSGLRFNIQKHQARRLHYDFRLEMGGVLKSWALAKGQSLDPHRKRLAIQVDDHSLDYADFEGVIPEGYGKGTVLLWDRGTWIPEGDPLAAYDEGKLEFTLRGKKLCGSFVLVRMARGGPKSWLLIKRHDRWEQSAEIVDEEPLSVLTKRNLDQIAADRDRVWTGCDSG